MTVLNDIGFLTLNQGGQRKCHILPVLKRELSAAISVSRDITLAETKTFSGEEHKKNIVLADYPLK